MDEETVNLSLGKAEALVLFELLADFHRQSDLEIKGNAERLALVRLHGVLEKMLVEPFTDDYKAILNRARSKLESEWGAD